jgi:hypothetical protein
MLNRENAARKSAGIRVSAPVRYSIDAGASITIRKSG